MPIMWNVTVLITADNNMVHTDTAKLADTRCLVRYKIAVYNSYQHLLVAGMFAS